MTEPKPYEIKVTSDPVAEEDRAQRWASAIHIETRPALEALIAEARGLKDGDKDFALFCLSAPREADTWEAHLGNPTQVVMLGEVEGQFIGRGATPREAIEDLLSLLPSKGYGRYKVENRSMESGLEDPNHKIVGFFDAPSDMIYEVICSCGWSGPDKEFGAHKTSGA